VTKPVVRNDIHDDVFHAAYCADRLKVLGDPLRLRIIDLLRSGELTVGDICKFLEVELGTVSHHLQILKHGKFITSRRDGRFMHYRLYEGLLQKYNSDKPVLDLGCCTLKLSQVSSAG